eukprot:GEMP01051717.1.p2 GENE.GEMP01051717.1~~GEMP01051717.1.p2  ORF type:complete len:105 (-),score=18.96 GEMP01051717.1:274-588(-)
MQLLRGQFVSVLLPRMQVDDASSGRADHNKCNYGENGEKNSKNDEATNHFIAVAETWRVGNHSPLAEARHAEALRGGNNPSAGIYVGLTDDLAVGRHRIVTNAI